MIQLTITLLTFVLILIGLFMVLVILMQRGSSSGGMGSAFGGGAAESAFGAETTNILTKATKWSAVAFFIISFVLYLLWMKQASDAKLETGTDLPDIPVAEAEATAEEVIDTSTDAAEEAISEVEANAEDLAKEASAEPES